MLQGAADDGDQTGEFQFLKYSSKIRSFLFLWCPLFFSVCWQTLLQTSLKSSRELIQAKVRQFYIIWLFWLKCKYIRAKTQWELWYTFLITMVFNNNEKMCLCLFIRFSAASRLMHGDIRQHLDRNASPCTARGCKWPKRNGRVYVPVAISSRYSKLLSTKSHIQNKLLSEVWRNKAKTWSLYLNNST